MTTGIPASPFSNSVAPTRKAPKAEKATALPPRRGPRTHDLTDGKSEHKLVPIWDLKDDPENPRRTYRKISELAASLKQEGMLQDIVARIDDEGNLFIMWGHRRIRAARLLREDSDPAVANAWTHVPCTIRYGVVDASVLAKQLIENSQREDLDYIEEARGVRHFMRENRIATYQECADRLGHSLTWVTNRAALNDLDEEDQQAVSSGGLTLLDAVKKAREASGKARKPKAAKAGSDQYDYDYAGRGGNNKPAAHFSDEHFLAGRARSRCNSGRTRGETHKPIIGEVACGSCWEVVIRLDARRNPDALAGDTH